MIFKQIAVIVRNWELWDYTRELFSEKYNLFTSKSFLSKDEKRTENLWTNFWNTFDKDLERKDYFLWFDHFEWQLFNL